MTAIPSVIKSKFSLKNNYRVLALIELIPNSFVLSLGSYFLFKFNKFS